MATGPKHIKVLFVGDEGQGKTRLLLTLRDRKYPEDATFAPFEKTTILEVINRDHTSPVERQVTFEMFDNKGKPEEYRDRMLRYYVQADAKPFPDVVVLCFSLADRANLTNLTAGRQQADRDDMSWTTELKRFVPDVPWMLLGTCCDSRAIPRADAERVAKLCKFQAYAEVSAKDGTGIDQMLETIVKCTQPRKKPCAIM